MGHGRSIRIYLADGSASGIRHAELVNWTGQAIVCPRARIGELKSWPESRRPGVYVLVGDDPDGTRPRAYIGEAENVYERLTVHLKDENKEFFDRVVFVSSKDDNLTKSHVKFLEARMVSIAIDVKRVSLTNINTPTESALPRADRDAMEEFLEPVRLLLAALGFQLLTPLAKRSEGKTAGSSGPLANVRLQYEVLSRNVKAEGLATDEGFVVLAGSEGGRILPSMRKGRRAIRAELIADGSVEECGEASADKEEEGKPIRFLRDVLFTSPSAAATVVSGSPANGWKVWKDKDSGKNLRELEDTVVTREAVEAS